MSMLKIDQLVSSYGVIKALKGVSVESGSIEYLGSSLVGKSSHEIISQGIAVVPEGRRIFADLTVVENLELGAYAGGNQKRFQELVKTVYEFFPRLEERKKQYGGTLSGGEQQMLAVGRAMMATPKLLLLDEPSMGLAPIVVEEVFKIIRRIKEMGTTMLLVEQNAMMALKVCDRAYIINTGEIVGEDTAEHIMSNQTLMDAYLGSTED